MAEVVNAEELARIATRIEPEPGHGTLLDALRRVYPGLKVTLVSMSFLQMEIGALIGRAGEAVAEDYKDWLINEYRSAGGDPKAVYRKYKEAGMAISEEQGEHVVITISYGEQPEDFLQLEFEATHRVAERLLLDKWLEPDDLDDLFHPSGYLDHPRILTPWRYVMMRVTNVRTFLRDLINLSRSRRTELPQEARFFQDWRESSAGLSGAILCDHWWLDVFDDRPLGDRLSYIPRWAHSDCSFPYVSLGGNWASPSPGSLTSPPNYSLPRVESSDHRSIYTMMAVLEEFDQSAGYPMAWYFYMLHGNRVEPVVGDRVAKAIEEGRIRLPKHDAEVLVRWRENRYVF